MMSSTTRAYDSLDDWIAREAIPFSLAEPETLNAAVDALVAALGDVAVLGFGEALHGGEEILQLRNRLFQRLVEAHGYSAIAIESSLPRTRAMNEYVAGGGGSYDALQDTGASHGFGRLEANRELVEWMRAYNADRACPVTLRLYGFDTPTEFGATDSPRQCLHSALDYLATVDAAGADAYRQRMDALLGQDAAWENPAAMFDPSQSVGNSPDATALRIETEDLIETLRTRRVELVAHSDIGRYREGAHDAALALWLLNYHATLARPSDDRIARGLAMRDAMMADNLIQIAAQERGRGKVLAFAHNSHLQRGAARWQLGPDLHIWYPAGGHLHAVLGARYAVIGTGLGASEANGIGQPEAGTLEALLTAAAGPARWIPTHRGRGLPAAEVAKIPTRSASRVNTTYFALTASSLADFDGLTVLDSATYARGGPPLQA